MCGGMHRVEAQLDILLKQWKRLLTLYLFQKEVGYPASVWLPSQAELNLDILALRACTMKHTQTYIMSPLTTTTAHSQTKLPHKWE